MLREAVEIVAHATHTVAVKQLDLPIKPLPPFSLLSPSPRVPLPQSPTSSTTDSQREPLQADIAPETKILADLKAESVPMVLVQGPVDEEEVEGLEKSFIGSPLLSPLAKSSQHAPIEVGDSCKVTSAASSNKAETAQVSEHSDSSLEEPSQPPEAKPPIPELPITDATKSVHKAMAQNSPTAKSNTDLTSERESNTENSNTIWFERSRSQSPETMPQSPLSFRTEQKEDTQSDKTPEDRSGLEKADSLSSSTQSNKLLVEEARLKLSEPQEAQNSMDDGKEVTLLGTTSEEGRQGTEDWHVNSGSPQEQNSEEGSRRSLGSLKEGYQDRDKYTASVPNIELSPKSDSVKSIDKDTGELLTSSKQFSERSFASPRDAAEAREVLKIHASSMSGQGIREVSTSPKVWYPEIVHCQTITKEAPLPSQDPGTLEKAADNEPVFAILQPTVMTHSTMSVPPAVEVRALCIRQKYHDALLA